MFAGSQKLSENSVVGKVHVSSILKDFDTFFALHNPFPSPLVSACSEWTYPSNLFYVMSLENPEYSATLPRSSLPGLQVCSSGEIIDTHPVPRREGPRECK